MKKILVLGATGTVGVYTTDALCRSGYDVIAVGRRKSDNGFFKTLGARYVSVDITKKNDFAKLPKDAYAVIHLAGAMPAAMQGYHPHLYVQTNIDGTLNVMEYIRDNAIAKVIFSHSRADSNYLMGTNNPIPSDIVKKFPLTGDHSIYSISKNAAVDIIEHFYHQYGIKRYVLRFPTIYAYHPDSFYYVNGERRKKAYRLLIEKAIKGETIEIWGNPAISKEIVYVKDAVQMILRCVESELDGGVYNVGRGVGVTLEEQIRGIINVFSSPNSRSNIIYKPEKPNARQFIHDISKAKKELGYEPKYNYIDLLKDFKLNMQNNPYKLLWGEEKDYN